VKKNFSYFTLLFLCLWLSIYIFIFTGCGATKYARVSSTQIIPSYIEINPDSPEVEREIITIREVLLAEKARKLLKDKKKFKKMSKYERQEIKERINISNRLLKEKKREVKANVEIITKKLRNFEALKAGMTLNKMRNLGFDMAAQNVVRFPGTKALTLWYTEQGIIPPPPHYLDDEKVGVKDISRLTGYYCEEKFIPMPDNGAFWAFMTNRETEIVLGFHFEFELWTKKNADGDEVLIAKRKGGPRVIFHTREEYESKHSKILSGFKNPIRYIPSF
jgi:hypothetical protein